MSRILLKYPTRSRPALFRSTLTRWREMLSGKHEARFVISCDVDDDTMNNAEMRGWIAEQPACVEYFNPPPQTKVSAINANMAGQEFDLLLLVSDDMLPEVQGYDDRIVTLFRQYFPEGDGVLHLNDGRVGRTLNTLPILDRKYYDRTHGIYPEHYASVYCDNEFQEVSERLGRAAYVDEVLIRHAWVDATGRDELHRRNEHSALYDADRRTFQKRQAAGFP